MAFNLARVLLTLVSLASLALAAVWAYVVFFQH
jgi:hypothetical protein